MGPKTFKWVIRYTDNRLLVGYNKSLTWALVKVLVRCLAAQDVFSVDVFPVDVEKEIFGRKGKMRF